MCRGEITAKFEHNHVYQYTQMVNAPAGGRQAQPGVATGQSHLAWRLGYAEVFEMTLRLPRCDTRP